MCLIIFWLIQYQIKTLIHLPDEDIFKFSQIKVNLKTVLRVVFSPNRVLVSVLVKEGNQII